MNPEQARAMSAPEAKEPDLLLQQVRELDELVHALYGLTPEEIQIVEGSAQK